MECHHRHIVERGMTLLLTVYMSIILWSYTDKIATYLINILPTKILYGLFHFEVLYGKAPKYDALKVFGNHWFSCMRDYNHYKFDTRFVECIFLVYVLNQKVFVFKQIHW